MEEGAQRPRDFAGKRGMTVGRTLRLRRPSTIPSSRRGAGRAAAGRGETPRRRGTPFPKLILTKVGLSCPFLPNRRAAARRIPYVSDFSRLFEGAHRPQLTVELAHRGLPVGRPVFACSDVSSTGCGFTSQPRARGALSRRPPACFRLGRRRYVVSTVGPARLCSPYFCAYGGNGRDREAATGANGLPPDSFQSRAGCAPAGRVRWLSSCGPEALREPVR